MRGKGNSELADDTSDVSKSDASRTAGSIPAPTSPARRRNSVKAGDGQVGQTLRTVYQQTVNENIPAEMLDLLGKLA